MQTVKQYQQALWQEILAGGALTGPAVAIRDAFFATPRHHFIGRYRTWHDPAWRSGMCGYLSRHFVDFVWRR